MQLNHNLRECAGGNAVLKLGHLVCGKSKCGAGQPVAPSRFGWGAPDQSFKWEFKDNPLCKSAALCWAWHCPLQCPPAQTHPALWVHHPLAIRLQDVLQPSLQFHFPADLRWSKLSSTHQGGSSRGAGAAASPESRHIQHLCHLTCWVWGSPFPLGCPHHLDKHGENDQETGRKFF